MRLRVKSQLLLNVVFLVSLGGFLLLFLHSKDDKTQDAGYRGVVGPTPGLHRPVALQQQHREEPSQTLSKVSSEAIPVNASMRVKLIILTYMRSGSSLTGDVFNHHPEVFYVFEPLWSIQKYFQAGPNLVFRLNKGPVQPDPKRFYEPSSLGTYLLKAFLDCDVGSLDPRTLVQYHLKNSLTTAGYYSCMLKEPGVVGSIRCLPKMVIPCRRANVTAVKTIRFTMAQATHLIERDPMVKVVHLIRDPRGTLRSQARVGEFKSADLGVASQAFCDRVLKDLRESEKLKTLHKGSVLTARYEDLAMQPLKFAKRLLNFVGLDLNAKLRQYVWNITSAGLPDNCIICTTRNDSKKTAMGWRTKLAFEGVKVVDNSCKEVYRRLGYLPLASKKELLNMSIPSFQDSSAVPGLWV